MVWLTNANAGLTKMPTTEHKPHPDPEKSFSAALHQMGRFNRRNLAAALEDFGESPHLDALGHASDLILEALDCLNGEMEMDADGVPTESVNENQYAEW